MAALLLTLPLGVGAVVDALVPLEVALAVRGDRLLNTAMVVEIFPVVLAPDPFADSVSAPATALEATPFTIVVDVVPFKNPPPVCEDCCDGACGEEEEEKEGLAAGAATGTGEVV